MDPARRLVGGKLHHRVLALFLMALTLGNRRDILAADVHALDLLLLLSQHI